MAKVIIQRSELPIPVSDHINKFRYRVVNDNRNIFSDWSVINYVYQETLDPNSRDGLPGGGNPGDVLTPIVVDPVDNWDIGWTPVATWAEENGIITSDTNHDIPAGGTTGQVLSKVSDVDYDVFWDDNLSLPEGGETGQYLRKSSAIDGDAYWGIAETDPQDGNFIIGIAVLA